MSTRFLMVAVLALAFSPAAIAAQPDAPRPFDPAKAVASSPLTPLTLVSLFETSAEMTLLADGSVIVEAPIQDVLVAHREADGSVVVSCVATPEAAARLLAKKIEAQASTPKSQPEEK
jgi:hypothetical protein